MPRPSWFLKKKPASDPKVSTPAALSSASNLSAGTGTIIQRPPDILQEHAKSSKTLWDQAYEDLRKEKKDLITAYEQILMAEPQIETESLHDGQSSKREKQMSLLVAKKLEIMNTNQWRFNIGNKSVEIREQVDRIVKVVLVAKDFVSSVASMEPVHAGLPWAGVCVLLPLLTNDGTQRTDVMNGLEQISRLVSRYTQVEHVYFQGEDTALTKELQNAMIKLYNQVLEYEARAACQFNRNVAFQFARNLVKADSWKDILDSIRASEVSCDKILQIVGFEAQRERLDTCLSEQSQLVEELLRASRVQDEEYQKKHLAELQAGREEQKDWRQEQQDWKLSQEQSKCLECLRTTPYERNKEKNKDPVKGTCKWFLEHPKYLEWLEKRPAGFLWVTADPGCGKSVLSKYLLSNYERERLTSRQNVCYYFFKDDSEENKSATHALCALLHQLFTQNAALLKHAIPSFENNGKKLSDLFDALWDIFTMATTDPDAGSTICVLDALDECAELSRLALITKLADFYSNSNTNTRLKFLITSRPNTTIQNEISRRRKLDLESIQLMGENETEMKAISNEISLVIEARVEEFRLLRSRRKVHDQAHIAIQKRLLDIDNRTYLWVTLIFPELENNAGLHERKLLKLIETIPSTVDEAYEKILAQSSNIAQAKKLLHIIVAAVRPLTVNEINVALSIQDNHKSLDECELECELSFRDTIRKLCGLFIIIQDSRVYLIHQTAKEFLLSGEISNVATINTDSMLNKWKHSLNLNESNLVLTESCVSYLLFSVFEDHPLIITSNPITIAHYISKHNFLDYAARHWFIHFRRAADLQVDVRVIKSMLRLCDTQSKCYQTWFHKIWDIPSFSWTLPLEYKPQFLEFTDLALGSYLGIEPVVKLLLEHKDIDVNSADTVSNRTALWWAADKGYLDVVKLLLRHKNINPNSKDHHGDTPLCAATRNGNLEVVKLLLEYKDVDINVDINVKGRHRRTLLWNALIRRHKDIVELLLQYKEIDPNQKLEYRITPLNWAVRQGDKEMVELLLRHKDIDPNLEEPLMEAVNGEHQEIVALLLGHKDIDPNLKDWNGVTPLWWAIRKGGNKMVKTLLNHKDINPNVKDDGHFTPLWWALLKRRNEMVKFLLSHKNTDPNLEYHGRTPLWWATSKRHAEIVKLLLEHDSTLKNRAAINSALQVALSRGHEQIVQLFIEKGAGIGLVEEREDRAPHVSSGSTKVGK